MTDTLAPHSGHRIDSDIGRNLLLMKAAYVRNSEIDGRDRFVVKFIPSAFEFLIGHSQGL